MTHARSLIAALAMATLPLAVHAQTACGSWEELAYIPSGGRVSDMVAFDDGTGVQLYIAGDFQFVVDPVLGWLRFPFLARWDGVAWSAVPGLEEPANWPNNRAIDLEVWDDGTGPALYVGGDFEVVAGLVVNGLARWDGTAWSAVGDPVMAGNLGRVHHIHPHDAGDGERLYIGGVFQFPGVSARAPGVFVWDGAQWAPAGVDAPNNGAVYELESFGTELFATGTFTVQQGESFAGLARLDGDTWSMPFGDGQAVVGLELWPMQPWTIDGRDVLVAAGRYVVEQDGERIAANVAAWDGTRWDTLPGVEPFDLRGQPLAMMRFDDGAGDALFIGSGEPRSGFQSVSRWKHGQFGPAVGLVGTRTFALAVFDDGDGPALFAGGEDYGFARWRPAPCAADLTGDCTLDLFDFLEFQNLFDAGDPAADFDGDGALTIFDFLAYQNVFDAGCE